jgi:MFS family permease
MMSAEYLGMKSLVVETEEVREDPWVQDFLLTWINRFSFFLAHHLTRPLLPLYLLTFGASSTVIGAVIAVFTITSTIMRLPVGLLIDRLGRKPFLLSGIGFFTAGNFGYLWAPSILLMIPCRILHGIGWAGCTTAIATLAADLSPQRRRGELIGYAGMASSLAGALGPVAGFAVFDGFGYPGVFLAAGGLLIVSFLLGLLVPEPKNLLAKEKITHWKEVIAVRETLLPAITVAFISFGQGGTLTFLPIQALKLGLQNPGLWFGLYALCLLLSRPIAGPLSDRLSRRAVILPGLILNLMSLLLLASTTSPIAFWAAAIVGGLGLGAAQPALMTVAVDQTSAQRRGQSMAQFQCFFDVGIGLGSLSLGVLLDLTHQNFSIMYLATAVVCFVGLWFYHARG